MAGKYVDSIVVKNRYFKTKGGKQATGTKLSQHFKYLEHRPGDEGQERDENQRETREDRSIFDAESDHITRREAVSDVMDHTSHRVAYHHLVLSPDPHEPVTDLRQWTRDIMQDFAEHHNKDITWYAVQHQNTEHPHVHVVIAGGAEREGQDKREPVTIYDAELDELHRSAFDHSDHELYQQLDQMHTRDMQELQQEQTHTFTFSQQNGPER